MPRTETLTNVPDSDVERVIAQFRADGATAVDKTPEGGGTWKVVATFPDD